MPDEAPTTIACFQEDTVAVRAIVRARQRIGRSTAGDGSSEHDPCVVSGVQLCIH